MTAKCKRCGAEIVELCLSDQQKGDIMQIVDSGKRMQAVKKMVEEYSMNHAKAKTIMMHLNTYGKCHRCNFDNLVDQNVECPKCKCFNYNLK